MASPNEEVRVPAPENFREALEMRQHRANVKEAAYRLASQHGAAFPQQLAHAQVLEEAKKIEAWMLGEEATGAAARQAAESTAAAARRSK